MTQTIYIMLILSVSNSLSYGADMVNVGMNLNCVLPLFYFSCPSAHHFMLAPYQ